MPIQNPVIHNFVKKLLALGKNVEIHYEFSKYDEEHLLKISDAVFYESDERKLATYEALQSLGKMYPTESLIVYAPDEGNCFFSDKAQIVSFSVEEPTNQSSIVQKKAQVISV